MNTQTQHSGSWFEFKLPDIGEGVTEGEIVAWHVGPGTVAKEDAPMLDVMTDKATVTIGMPKSGKVLEIRGKVGDIAPVGSVLVVIDTTGSSQATTQAPPTPKTATPNTKVGEAATAVGDIKEHVRGADLFNASPAAQAKNTSKALATPAVRKLARDSGIDLGSVNGSGKFGRIMKEDLTASSLGTSSLGASFKAQAGTTPETPSSVLHGTTRAAIQIPVLDASLETRKPFVGIRRKIAERMQTSKNTAAHFTFVEECDASKLKALRTSLKPTAEAQGVKLTFLPFIVKAVIEAIKKHPVLNSALDETSNELVYRQYFNIGIAAQTDHGLMVPVIQNADRLSILELSKEIERLGNGARAGTLSQKELSGSTFTITSLGAQGGLFATPVLNFPEVGILGVHQMKQKPVVKNGQIVIGDVMLLSLSFDHRIVDGHVGAAFAYDIIGALENPENFLLNLR